MKLKRKLKQVSRKLSRNKKTLGFNGVVLAGGVLAILGGVYLLTRQEMKLNYSELLNVIALGESKGNYNAYFGNTNNNKINFTDMTIDEVLAWQDEFVKNGKPSNAVGRYQFIRPTLVGLVDELKISGNEKFTPELQDKLAIRLLHRRGIVEFAKGEISLEQFANNLSKEWAALPKVLGENPSASFYDGDGLNKAHVSVEKILAAIETVNQVG